MEGCGHVVRVGDAWCSEGAGRVAGRWPGKVGNQGVIHSQTNSKEPTLQACHQKQTSKLDPHKLFKFFFKMKSFSSN